MIKNYFATPTATVKRDILERFDESMLYTEDHDFFLRIISKYNETYYIDTSMTVINRPITSLGGQSASLWEMRKGEIKMYKKYCSEHKKMIFFPLFLFFSLSKHIWKKLRVSR